MNRRIVALAIALVLVIVGAVAVYAVTRPSAETAAETTTEAPVVSAAATGSGSYVNYSADAIAEADGRALLFFHATWCPSCRALEEDILANGAPDGTTIIKVDYDNYQDLRQKYGVTVQTTIVEVDSDGNELQSFNASGDPSVQGLIDALN